MGRGTSRQRVDVPTPERSEANLIWSACGLPPLCSAFGMDSPLAHGTPTLKKLKSGGKPHALHNATALLDVPSEFSIFNFQFEQPRNDGVVQVVPVIFDGTLRLRGEGFGSG